VRQCLLGGQSIAWVHSQEFANEILGPPGDASPDWVCERELPAYDEAEQGRF